jgi:Ni/Co efflux regulator RcnB
MKKSLLCASLVLILAPTVASAQQNPQQRDRPGGMRPDRPGGTRPDGPSTKPSPGRPGAGGPQIQPPRPVQPIRPIRPKPPKPVRPNRPHRPGMGRPPHFKPIHAPHFRYPHGYRYRRWSVGLLLPAIFLSSAYYYDRYSQLGVGAPPVGYRWVRYGPDLLLVEIRTRRVADVITGAFY